MIKLLQLLQKCIDFAIRSWKLFRRAGFSLSGGCFGTDIIQSCTKWSNMGVRGLSYGPFVATLRCASFLIRTNEEQLLYGPKQQNNVEIRQQIICEKLHASNQSWKKQMFRKHPLNIN